MHIDVFKDMFSVSSTTPMVSSATIAQQLFFNECIRLAGSLVIKIPVLADDINRRLARQGVVVSDDVTTWRHYLELGGLYPTTDVVTVLSLDDNTQVTFSTDVLANHSFTREYYSYNSDPYNELVLHNKKHETIIKSAALGITHSEVIAGDDFTIIGYDKRLVQPNEVSLISRLNQWIRLHVRRWYIPSYYLTDELYITAYVLSLHLSLALAVVTIREELSVSHEAHRFFIKERLVANGFNGEDIDVVPLKTLLYLHRNISRLQRHICHEATHLEIFREVLLNNGISVADVFLSEKTQVDALTGSTQHMLTHVPRLDNSFRDSIQQTRDVIGDIRDIQPPEIEYFNDALFTDKWNTSLINQFRTKIVHINPNILSSRLKINYVDYVIDQWAIDAYDGWLTYRPEIVMGDGNTVTLEPIEAFIFWIYIKHLLEGIKLVRIPSWLCLYSQPYNDYQYTHVSDMGLAHGVDIVEIDTYWGDRPVRYTYHNTDQFVRRTTDNYLNLAMMESIALTKNTPSEYAGHMGMATYFYGERALYLGERAYYDGWLADKRLDKLPENKSDLALLADHIMERSIGVVLGVDQEVIQKKALIEMAQSTIPYTTLFNNVSYHRPILLGATTMLTNVSITTL